MTEGQDVDTLVTLNLMSERLRTLQGYAAWIVTIGMTIALANLAALALLVLEMTRGHAFD